MSDSLPQISVVIIGRNEGDRLIRCLESVSAADYPAGLLEVIYVDSDSTDGSRAAAEKLGARVILCKPERPCAAAGRNAGLAEARYDIVQFLDGDTILHPDWLRKGVGALADTDLVCAFGRVEEMAPNATVYNFWAHHDWYVAPGPATGCGGIAMFKTAPVRAAGGYDDTLIAGEEQDLCCRLTRAHGACLLCLDEPMVLHDSDMTRFSQYWRRCIRSGYAYAETGSRYPELRSWRRTCMRNTTHALLAVIAVAFGLTLWSPWPIVAWAVLIAVVMARDAVRGRTRLGSWRAGVLCAVHHYLSKPPTAVGHIDFFVRKGLSLPGRRLIEHRGRPQG